MAQTERLYHIKRWLDAGRCLQRDWLLTELGVSRATLTRDLALLRDRMQAPIVFDAERGGWRLDATQSGMADAGELPGLWFNAEEVAALLTMQRMLEQLDASGLLARHIEPLRRRLQTMLGTGLRGEAVHIRRIRLSTVAARRLHLAQFQAVGTALLQRRRLRIDYHGRGRDERHQREVSPQRLVHYRDNWYLDAWCHWRDALRSFSLDAIQEVEVLTAAAIDVEDGELDEQLGAGYGIFAGDQVQWARLRFSAERARWVAHERWHPNQRGCHDAEGRWQLDLPYADPRELVMDILRHVPDVEVMWPPELVRAVCERLREGLAVMQQGLDE